VVVVPSARARRSAVSTALRSTLDTIRPDRGSRTDGSAARARRRPTAVKPHDSMGTDGSTTTSGCVRNTETIVRSWHGS
jgi:hypothetical protein